MPRQGDGEYKNKDFTDYFLLFLNTGRESEFFPAFKKLVDESKSIESIFPELFDKENILAKDLLETEYEEINFYDIIKQKYVNKPISFRAIVRGEAAKPYVYPVKVKINCDMTRGEMCATCGLFLTGGNLEIKLNNINPLELIDISNYNKISMIKRKTGIMQCGQFNIELTEQKYMQEVFLSPLIEDVTGTINPDSDLEKKEQRFIIRHAFCEGSEIIPNKSYKFYGTPTPSPKNQTLVYYIKKAVEEESDLDNFVLSDQDKKDLEIFQPENSDYNNIKKKLDDIYNDLSMNVSPSIRYRNDLMFACDLSFHSVLHFWFGTSFEKGWVETLIVGDTQVGKTKVTSKLIKHYKLGVIQGAENSTIAGLIGGMTKFESINIMTWGLLPLNNSRLVVLDEMSGINPAVFGELTRIRSEGIAERTIVGGSSSTPAKVRLIWLSNPRKRKMSLYDSGCNIIKELVGSEEDISRFDFILTISDDEVTAEQINSARTTGVGQGKYFMKHVYKSELCNKLILWVWSRKANQIIFDKGVESLILDYSIEMSKRYTSNFPLVLGSTIRLKIAKLSIALAARLFSIRDDNIFVTENHVAYIYEFLNRIYNKPSFGYGEYSDYFKTSEDKSKNSKDDLLQDLKNYCGTPDIIKSFIINMLTNQRITALEVKDFARCTRDQADMLRTKLVSNGFLIKKAGFYVKSDLFRKILKEKLKDIEKTEKEE